MDWKAILLRVALVTLAQLAKDLLLSGSGATPATPGDSTAAPPAAPPRS